MSQMQSQMSQASSSCPTQDGNFQRDSCAGMKSWHNSQVCCEGAPGITHLLGMRELGLLVTDINIGSLECGRD